MKSLIEWCFEFTIKNVATIDRVTAELLLGVAITWAEAKGYGVGGGFDSTMSDDNVKAWFFKFGLTTTKEDQLISEEDADELLLKLRHFCDARSYDFEGGFREFTEKELETFPIKE
jgi:hypothetical protein